VCHRQVPTVATLANRSRNTSSSRSSIDTCDAWFCFDAAQHSSNVGAASWCTHSIVTLLLQLLLLLILLLLLLLVLVQRLLSVLGL
jgi:hypothetical protein